MTALLQHYLNPLHIYCRLIDIGFQVQTAKRLAKATEKVIDYLIYTTIM